jgi:hypothetical protein
MWLAPGLVSLVASLLFALDPSTPGQEPVPLTDQALAWTGNENPRVPPALVRDEAEARLTRLRLDDANAAFQQLSADLERYKLGSSNDNRVQERSGALRSAADRRNAEEQNARTRRSFDLSTFLLAAEFGWISLLGAWFFSEATGRRRWLVRALPLVPALLLAVALFVRR